MGFFNNEKGKEHIDFDRLRHDLMDEYGAQMVTFSGALGFSDMCDAQSTSNEKLLEMAKREGIRIENYTR